MDAIFTANITIYNIVDAIFTANITIYNIVDAIFTANITIYNIVDAIFTANITIYNIVDAIFTANITIYNIVDAIFTANITIYNIVDAIFTANITIYNIVDAIFTANITIYNIVDAILKQYIHSGTSTSLAPARLTNGTAQWFRLANSARIFINLCWYYITVKTIRLLSIVYFKICLQWYTYLSVSWGPIFIHFLKQTNHLQHLVMILYYTK